MGLLDKVEVRSASGPSLVTCHKCKQSCEVPDSIELYFCPKCDSPLAEYPNIMADESLFSFDEKMRMNLSCTFSHPSAGIEAAIRPTAERAALGIITGHIKPTYEFTSRRELVQSDELINRTMSHEKSSGIWWVVFFVSLPFVIFIPPSLCCSALSLILALEFGAHRKASDVMLIAASHHPHLLAEEGGCYCYLRKEKLILAMAWRGHIINISTAIHHTGDAYLKYKWTSNSYGGGDDGYSVPAIEAVLRYPRRKRKIVMLNHEYTSKESAKKELKSLVEAEPWYPVLGAQFEP